MPENPLRVLLLGKYSTPRNGGVERHLDSLFEGFRALGGVNASLLTANESRGTVVEDWNGFRVVKASRLVDLNRLPFAPLYPRWFSNFSEVVPVAPSYKRWLRRMADVDVIHLHAPNPIAELAILGADPDVPLVVTEHCAFPRNAPLSHFYQRVHRAVLERADAFIVQSPNLLKACALDAAQQERARIIPSSLDSNRLKKDVGAAQRVLDGLHVDGPLYIFVGRLVEYKGVAVLLHALVGAPGAAVIVGVGPEERKLRALARRLGVENRARFLGAIEDATVFGLMSLADVLVLPSIDDREGFGLVLLEAHLMGTPTISTEVGTGTSFVNLHEQTGLVVPPSNAAALEGALRRIGNAPEEARQWGAFAKERGRKLFSVEEMARKTLQVYDGVT